jgi:hypothetical protein
LNFNNKWCASFVYVQPLLVLSSFPDAFTEVLIGVNDPSFAVLQAVFPVARVALPVRVGVDAVPVLFVFAVRSFVFATVLPDVLTHAVHHALEELSLEATAVSPLEDSMATHFVLLPFTCVPGAVGPEVDSIALLDAVCEVAVIVAAIAPDFDTVTALFLALNRVV